MNKPKSKAPANPAGRKEAINQEMYDVLEWITRCAHMRGPLGCTVYFITDEAMDRAKRIVKLAGRIK